MKCYNHINSDAVATCTDCSKGLCKSCADKFATPICDTCGLQRVNNDKRRLYNEFIWMLGVVVVSVFLIFNFPEFWQITEPQLLETVAFLYGGVSIVGGWYTLSKFTSKYFLFLPIIGWIIYFILKLYFSALIGPFVTPFRLYRNTRRLIKLGKIQKSAAY